MSVTNEKNSYQWQDHTSPNIYEPLSETADLAEGIISDGIRKITAAEALEKQNLNFDAEMMFAPDTAFSSTIDPFNFENINTKNLIAVINSLDKTDLNVATDSQDGALENNLNSKLEKLNVLALQQSEFLAKQQQQTSTEFQAILARYKAKNDKLAKQLEAEQANNKELLKTYQQEIALLHTTNAELTEKIQILQAQQQQAELNKQTNLNSASNLAESSENPNNDILALQDKLEKLQDRLIKLDAIVKMEQKLRSQSEERAREILGKAKRIKELLISEKQQREIAQSQTHQAVNRARRVMSYFFNAACMEDWAGINSAANLLKGSFAEFDSVMLTRKPEF